LQGWTELQNFAKRLQVLEARMNADRVNDEQTKTRLFLERLTDQELDRYAVIAERTNDGQLPLTEEELRFLDDLEVRYWPIGETKG
jgi:hypothetical protein